MQGYTKTFWESTNNVKNKNLILPVVFYEFKAWFPIMKLCDRSAENMWA
jgi:hypothetical protein